jgi:hypothetical protein
MKVTDPTTRLIGYRLNILGVRITEKYCQLVAKTAEGWTTIGPPRELPVYIPRTAGQLKSVASDPLLLTACQYAADFPASDIRDVLSEAKSFQNALTDAIVVMDAI